jgi:hypothetical protein
VLAFYLSLLCCTFFAAFFVRLLGGSFGFFSVGLCVENNTKEPPTTLIHMDNFECIRG